MGARAACTRIGRHVAEHTRGLDHERALRWTRGTTRRAACAETRRAPVGQAPPETAMTLATDQLERLAIDTIRTLAIDGVQQANSGHPGAPMGMAPMAYTLWTRHLRHAPTQPGLAQPRPVRAERRPRVDAPVLAAPPDRLRRRASTTSSTSASGARSRPGHPEYGLTPGVEATTGPLGQGLANAVGMAIAERRLAFEFNRPGHDIVDHRTYVIARDGDLQEGVASEASSLAGHLRLGKLIALYDDNRIQLDGPTAWAFSEDVLGRFAAYGWHTQRVEDGTDVEAIAAPSTPPRPTTGRRSSPSAPTSATARPNKQDTQKAHGAPLGPDEVRLTKEAYGWDPDKTFYVPDEAARAVPAGDRRRAKAGRGVGVALRRLRRRVPGRGRGAQAAARRPAPRRLGRGPARATRPAPRSRPATRARTRSRRWPGRCPELFGGSADLSESNLTDVKANGHDHFEADHAGRNLRFGVREHGMGVDRQRHRVPRRLPALLRDVPHLQRLHARRRPAGGAVRAARDLRLDARLGGPRRGRPDAPAGRALRGAARDPQPVVRAARRRQRGGGGLGAGGRAADDRGRAAGPVALALTRQKLPTLRGDAGDGARGRAARRLRAARGGGGGTPQLILIGTGSELQLAFAAAEAARGRRDPDAGREPARAGSGSRRRTRRTATRSCRRPSGSGSASRSASRWAGSAGSATRGRSSGIDHFGASAPAGTIFKEFGFTADRVADVGRRVVREGLHGGSRRSASPHGEHPTLEPGRRRRRPDPGQRPGPRRLDGRERCASCSPPTTPGAAFKDELIRRLVGSSAGEHELIDLGGDGSDPDDDYPDFAQRLGLAIQDGRADRGILICGSGVGASVAANKIRGIRTAVCHDTYSAHQGVEHDDMNVLTLGARVIGIEPAVECSLAFLAARSAASRATSAAWTRCSRSRPPARASD